MGLLVAETQPRHHTRLEILQHTVRSGHDAAGDLQPWEVSTSSTINRLPAFTAIKRGHAVVAPIVAVTAHSVAAAGRLDLGDVGAQQVKDMGCVYTPACWACRLRQMSIYDEI